MRPASARKAIGRWSRTPLKLQAQPYAATQKNTISMHINALQHMPTLLKIKRGIATRSIIVLIANA
jgi:hypothetical protein